MNDEYEFEMMVDHLYTTQKLSLLREANKKLHIVDDSQTLTPSHHQTLTPSHHQTLTPSHPQTLTKRSTNTNRKALVFVYCPPKVGSTSLVSSIRLSAMNTFQVFHIHDETMLSVLCGIKGITVNEIIQYNRLLGREVYVIDIYRTPIEHKISVFFEKIASFHFNNTEEEINTYSMKKIVHRFNRLFPYLATDDYYRTTYCIPVCHIPFDHNKKYLHHTCFRGIHYVKLRLQDSTSHWTSLLRDIMGTNITIVRDYETDSKTIHPIFQRFKAEYKIPINFLSSVMECPQLQYYLSPQERDEYISQWSSKTTGGVCIPFNDTEYRLYNEISVENKHINDIQRNHYIDSGCVCMGCSAKRQSIIATISNTKSTHNPISCQPSSSPHHRIEHINHRDANMEYINTKNKLRMDALVRKIGNISHQKNQIQQQHLRPNILIKSLFSKTMKTSL